MPGGESIQPTIIEPSGFTPLSSNNPPPPVRRNPLKLALLVCAGLFILVIGFLLSARSVHIQVIAETSSDISISGLALPFGERYLLRPGEYQINASAQGYQPLHTGIEVSKEDNQQIALVLIPLPGLLTITTEPPGASITLAGDVLGNTPLHNASVAAGEHTLLVQEPRHLPLSRSIEITGRQISQELDLQLEPAWAEVTLTSLPEGATILVDGKAVGTTPSTVELIQGERQLAVHLDSYAHWQQSVDITAGVAQTLERIELQPAPGILELNSTPSGANVTVNGEFQGQTPLSLELDPQRSHRVAVFKPGYRRHTATISIAAAGSAQRDVRLQVQLGEVRFRIEPSAAVLRINGKLYGNGDQVLSLPAVEHTVDISLEGYVSARQRVMPRQGLPQLVEVTLLTERDARMVRIKPEITTSVGQTMLLFNPAESALADFTMGASRRDPGRRANEVLHPVGLRRMFYLQTTEVTNAQFRQFQPNHNSGQIDSNSLNREHQPAAQVSWQQAAAFCNWLSQREGLPAFYRETQGIVTGYNASATGYRLPTETEWAWAARAKGSALLTFPWGDTFPPTKAVENYADNSSAYVTGRVLNNYTDGHVVSAPVASLTANQHGLYDLGGNVAEWVHDVYAIPSANGATRVDALGSQQGDNYVIRGASWAHSRLGELRLSYRDYGQAGRDDVGFRIARYAE